VLPALGRSGPGGPNSDVRTTRAAGVLTVGVLSAGLTLAGGAGETQDEAAGKGGAVTVTATDSECDVGDTSISSGTRKFKVTNKGSKVTEFYVYAEGDRIMGEVENIAPGLSRELIVELAAGTYETACKPGMTGKGIRGKLTVSGEAPAHASTDAKLADATKSYQRYVNSQSTALVEKTTEFVNAVKAGDIPKAKALFPVARTYWERIEPVAEIFGDLDPLIDGRETDIEPGGEFTGYHKLEKDLWVSNNVAASGPMADRLLADVKKVVDLASKTQLTPLQLANGSKELLDEVATGKITGEEDRYSHTDLWDFQANVQGSQGAIAALRPVLEERDPKLVAEIDTRFAAVNAALAKHAKGEGFKLYTELAPAEIKELSDAVSAVSEPVSKVAAVVAKK
jgi:iron uptake system component EfeO